MLSGLTVRMAHALQLNLEYVPTIPQSEGKLDASLWTDTESRRRVMWACYVLDTWTGSGVDQLTLLHESDIKIQLPCSERNFLFQSPCTTEHLYPSLGHPPILSADMSSLPRDRGGMMSQYIRLIAIWKRVARQADPHRVALEYTCP